MRPAMRILTITQYDRLVEQWNRTYRGARADRIRVCRAQGHVWRGVPVGEKEEPRLVCVCCLRYMIVETRQEAVR